MKRWLVAGAALLLGGVVSASFLFVADPARNSVEAYAVARDLRAGAVIDTDSVQLERVSVASGQDLLFVVGQEGQLTGRRAGHDLQSGQLIQRSDLLAAGAAADHRLVFVPMKDAPAADPGDRVDLLVLSGSPDRPTVSTFALNVEVRAQLPNGLVLVVTSRQAPAFVYAASSMHLAAVIAEPGAAAGAESPVESTEQAIAEAGAN